MLEVLALGAKKGDELSVPLAAVTCPWCEKDIEVIKKVKILKEAVREPAEKEEKIIAIKSTQVKLG